MPPEHPLQLASDIVANVLKTNEAPQTVSVMLGVQLIDRTGTDSNNATDYGQQVRLDLRIILFSHSLSLGEFLFAQIHSFYKKKKPYDNRFKIATEADQEKMLELCEKIATVSTGIIFSLLQFTIQKTKKKN